MQRHDSVGSIGAASSVQVDLRVGMVDLTLAKMLTKGHHIIEFPTLLLPEDVRPGSIVRLTCERDLAKESADNDKFVSTQRRILEKYAQNTPKKPVLRARNVTQTTAVLNWDPIQIATADLRALTLYKDGERVGIVPDPLHRTTTKLTSLEIDQKCQFQLVLSTSAGDFASDPVLVHTHKMTDLTGVTVCVGSLKHSSITLEDLEQAVERMGANPLQTRIKLDTTHFICTTEEGEQCKRAKDLNIPVVRPEWLKACEMEKRLVSVAAYYISADPNKIPEPVRNSGSNRASVAVESKSEEPQPAATETAQEKAEEEEDAKARQPLADSAADAPETTEQIEERAEADAQAEAAKTYETQPEPLVDAEDVEAPAGKLPNPVGKESVATETESVPLSEEAREEPYVGADLGMVPDEPQAAEAPVEAAEAAEAIASADAVETAEVAAEVADAAVASGAVEPEVAEPEAEPETVVEPETETVVEPETETAVEPETEVVEPEAEAVVEPETEAVVETAAEGETETPEPEAEAGSSPGETPKKKKKNKNKKKKN